jgi:lipid-binding SYLF domain-containing protein
MRRFVLAAAMLTALLLPGFARADMGQDAQSLVDRATLSLQSMMTQQVSQDPQSMLQRARAVMICPRIFKAGFFFGGSGGSCVLVARAGNGTWSYPAFYAIGSGSFGFQFGIEDSSLFMMIMTQRGLNAVMDAQFKLGADASVAVATLGGTVGGATTAAVGADIVVFAETRGLFGGVSVEGSIMSLSQGLIQAYYGRPYSAREIVVNMLASNPGADPLREVLTRYGTRGAIETGAPPPPPPGGPGPARQGMGYAPAYPPAGQAPAYPPSGQAPAYPPANQAYGQTPANPPSGYNQPPAYPPPNQAYDQTPAYPPPPYGQGAPNTPVQAQPLAPPSR